MQPTHALWILIVVSAAVRLICSSCLGLGNDEAYHFLYAVHPGLSYFDHPPMMAWVEMAGLALPGAGDSALGLRIGFITLFAGSTLLIARLATRRYGPEAGLMAAFGLNVSGYYGLAASTFALPDGPLLFFWLLSLDRLTVALDDVDPRRLWPWMQVGLAWGGALLSKYHAVLIPVGAAICVLLDPAMRRRWLGRRGPLIALALGLIVFSPVIVWNAQHGWVSFRFQAGRAVGSWVPRPDFLAVALVAQAAYLFPWIWLPLVLILARAPRLWSQGGQLPERLWLCVAAVPLGVFTILACFRQVLPHWGLIGFVSLLPVLGKRWATRRIENPIGARLRLAGYASLSLLVVSFAIAQFRTGWLQRTAEGGGGPLDTRSDPTLDLYGWDQIAGRIRQLGLIDNPSTFVFTRYWYQSAQIAHALGGGHPVLCYNADDPRGFAFWSRPEDWVGRDGVLVLFGSEADVVALIYARWFAHVEPVSDFWVTRHGKPVRHVRLYRCAHQQVAFPFGLDRAVPLVRAEDPARRITR
jgi:hypothetical protein